MIDLSTEIADPSGYLPSDFTTQPSHPQVAQAPKPGDSASFEEAVRALVEYARGGGYVLHPWQVATYVTAVRTKPFIVLAGISGTGK